MNSIIFPSLTLALVREKHIGVLNFELLMLVPNQFFFLLAECVPNNIFLVDMGTDRYLHLDLK